MSLHIVLTGASRGLGLAMAEGFAAAGHRVSGCCRGAENAAKLNGRFGAPHRFHAVDVARDEAVAAWAKGIHAEAGPADMLVNNAALMNEPAMLWEVSAAEFDALFAVNLSGTANAIRHFVPPMVARGRGTIVNFSSGWGRSVSPQVAPYCATKWAVEGLTKALAKELPAGMAAVALNPGVIDTDMLRTAFGDAAGGYPNPQAWAKRAVPYLLSLSAKHNGDSATVPSS